MAAEPEIYRKEAGSFAEFDYRCPGCGEVVDRRELDAVLTHHQHVLHPKNQQRWFEREPLVKSVNERPLSRTDSTGSSALSGSDQPDRRYLRRYGHG